MDEKEGKSVLKQIKEQLKKLNKDKSDEEIDKMMLDAFFKEYCEDKMSREDLTALVDWMGYEVKDDVLDAIEEEKKEGKK